MNHIDIVQKAVRARHGAGHEEVAATAAVAARIAAVEELDAHYRERLDRHAASLRVALELLREDHRHSQAAAEDRLQSLLEELEA